MAYEITGNVAQAWYKSVTHFCPEKPSKFKDLFKSVLCGPRADLWPFYGFLVIAPVCSLFLSYSSETANQNNVTKVSRLWYLKSGHIQRLQKQSFFLPIQILPNVKEQFRAWTTCYVMFCDELDLRKSCKERNVEFRKPPGKQDRCTETNSSSVHCCLKRSTWGHNEFNQLKTSWIPGFISKYHWLRSNKRPVPSTRLGPFCILNETFLIQTFT